MSEKSDAGEKKVSNGEDGSNASSNVETSIQNEIIMNEKTYYT